MNPLSRRAFLHLAVASMAGSALGATGLLKGVFPVVARARLAVASYPFRAFIAAPNNRDHNPAKGNMGLAEFAQFVRDRFDVRGVEPLDSHFASTEPKYVADLRARLRADGMRVVNIPVDERVELCSNVREVREHGNARYRRWIDIAATLGSPSVRLSLPRCAELSDVRETIRAFAPTLQYARRQRIVVLLENDDPVVASAARLVSVIQRVHSPWLRALPDFANSLMGGDEAFNRGAVSSMFADAWSVAHVKDAEMIEGRRETVALPELFAIARKADYRGFYSMESDSDADPVTDTKHLIERTLALM